MKTCPFCSKKPTISDGVATCAECNITVPVATWQNQRDVEHEIDGQKWVTDGARVMLAATKPKRLAMPRGHITLITDRPDWTPVDPDGYAMGGGRVLMHRYRLGDTIIRVNAAMEADFGYDDDDEELDIGNMYVDASPIGGGHLLRYCFPKGSPRLFVMSLAPDAREIK